MDALCATALACKLRDLNFSGCGLLPASVPALARLVRGGFLEYLHIFMNDPLLDEAGAVQLADALAESRAMKRLELCDVHFWSNAAAFTAIIRALTGHPCLQTLQLSGNPIVAVHDQFAAGAALSALVGANSPALDALVLTDTLFGDAGMGGLCYVLLRNTHLRELDVTNTGMSEEFVRAASSCRRCAPTRRCASCILAECMIASMRWRRRRRWLWRATTVADR